MVVPAITVSSVEDLLQHLQTTSSFPPSPCPLEGSTGQRVHEAVQNFVVTADAALRELNITETSLSPRIVEILTNIRKFLVSSSKQWDPMRPSPSSPSSLDIFLNPSQAAVRSSSAALELMCKKQLLCSRSQSLLFSLRQKNEHLTAVLSECSGNFEEVTKVSKAREALLSRDHLETLEYTSDVYRAKVAVLQKESQEHRKAPEQLQIEESLEKLVSLRAKKAALAVKLAKKSAKGALPPIMGEGMAKLNERQSYFDHLVTRIKEQESELPDFNLSLADQSPK